MVGCRAVGSHSLLSSSGREPGPPEPRPGRGVPPVPAPVIERREAWLTAAALFLLALAIRIAAAAAVRFPVPEDTAYYAGVARNLVDGHGLVSNALWSYQTQPLVVPRAAFEVWLPLPTFLAAVPMALAGTANWFRAAQVSSVLVSATIPVLAWRLAADAAAEKGLPIGRVRLLALGSGVVAAVLGPLVVYGALPDSTAPFAVLSLAACLLMNRISARPQGPRDARLVVLGALLGLAALTRSDAIWLGLAWAALAWLWTGGTARQRAAMIVIPAAIAAAIYLPWSIRDWQAFGTPLPGQTLSNALYVTKLDVYAFSDQPTLARYLAQGPLALAQSHVAGFSHDLVSVLATQSFPIGLVGLIALPVVWRLRAVRALLLTSSITFLITSLVFPVSTQLGTFLHAAGAIYVLLIVACLFGLDALIARIGRIRHWTRPVAWLGPTFAIVVAVPLAGLSVGSIAANARDTESRYQQLQAALDRAGTPLEGSGPVIANFPVWVAETTGARSIALPDESPASVLSLAHQFGSRLVILDVRDDDRRWPAVLADNSAAAACFAEFQLTDINGAAPSPGSPLSKFHVFRVVCP